MTRYSGGSPIRKSFFAVVLCISVAFRFARNLQNLRILVLRKKALIYAMLSNYFPFFQVHFSSFISSPWPSVGFQSSSRRLQLVNILDLAEWHWSRNCAHFWRVIHFWFDVPLHFWYPTLCTQTRPNPNVNNVPCLFTFSGVGIATMVLVFFLDIYYCVIIAWTFFYLIATFTAIPDLPWDTCSKPQNKQIM